MITISVEITIYSFLCLASVLNSCTIVFMFTNYTFVSDIHATKYIISVKMTHIQEIKWTYLNTTSFMSVSVTPMLCSTVPTNVGS